MQNNTNMTPSQDHMSSLIPGDKYNALNLEVCCASLKLKCMEVKEQATFGFYRYCLLNCPLKCVATIPTSVHISNM